MPALHRLPRSTSDDPVSLSPLLQSFDLATRRGQLAAELSVLNSSPQINQSLPFAAIAVMPIRVKSRPMSQGDRAVSPTWAQVEDTDLPDIGCDDAFRDVVKSLSR